MRAIGWGLKAFLPFWFGLVWFWLVMASGLLEDQKEILLVSKYIFFHSSNYEQRGTLSNKGRKNGAFVKKKHVSG